METVVLVILLILALALIGVVLLQRSEGGGLGMGAGGLMTGRGQATALGRATWIIGGAFMAACVAMTIISARNAGGASVVDQLRSQAGVEEGAEGTDGAVGGLPDLGDGSLLPPPAGEAPLVPSNDAPLVPLDGAPLDDAAPADGG